MTQDVVQNKIIETLQTQGGINVPVENVINECSQWVDGETIREIILDMCRQCQGIHYGMSDSKGVITISLNTSTPVKLPPNQNSAMQ